MVIMNRIRVMVMAASMATVLAAPSAARAQSAADHAKAGTASLNANNADAAVKSFEKAIAAEPNNSDYHLWLARAVGTVAQNASVLRQPFLARRAKAEFEKAVQLDPNSIGGREGMMQFYLLAPSVMGGSLGKAREQAAVIAKLNPMRGFFARATIANNQKDPATAEKEIRGAAAAFPDSLNALTSLVNVHTNANRPDTAFAVLDKYLSKHPDDLTAQFWIGRTAAVLGVQLDRGEKAIKTVMTAPGVGTETGLPTLWAAHFRLGQIAVHRGNKVLAKQEFEKCLAINPKYEPAKRALKTL